MSPKIAIWALALAIGPMWVHAATPKKVQNDPILRLIRKDLAERTSVSFDHLLTDWEEKYGARAVPSLISIASDSTLPDPDRYIALMGSAKLGGEKITTVLTPFLKDPSWMIRSASLKIISAFDKAEEAQKFHPAVLGALKDPALVVRAEAISTLERLKAPGFESTLYEILEEPSNYHKGVAQWVPQRALQALMKIPVAKKEEASSRAAHLGLLLKREDLIREDGFRQQLAHARQFLMTKAAE